MSNLGKIFSKEELESFQYDQKFFFSHNFGFKLDHAI